MRISMKKYRTADFCENQIDVITNFAVITNVVLKRVHCFNNVGNTDRRHFF